MQLRWFHAVDFHLKLEGASREWVVKINTDCLFVKKIDNARKLTARRIREREHHTHFQLAVIAKGTPRHVLKVSVLRLTKALLGFNRKRRLFSGF
jgi:hypothetical protein